MKYYYLVASLPVLALGEPAPCTAAEFRARCEGVLSPVDARELRGLLEGRAGEAQSAFARGWFAADTQLRNAAARLRATPMAVEAKGFLREHPGFTAALEKAVVDAFAKPHPGERELELDRCRWLVADELALPVAKVQVVFDCDTSTQPYDWQTVASRFAVMGGNAVIAAAQA